MTQHQDEVRKAMRSHLLNEADELVAKHELPKLDSHLMALCQTMLPNAICARRRVACLLTDIRGDIIGAGWNQQPESRGQCSEAYGCPGAAILGRSAGSKCESVHAEIHALMSCPDVSRIYQCFCTSSPCNACVRALLLTPCKRIVFDYFYPNPDAQDWWEQADREWVHLTGNKGIYPGGCL